MEPTSLSLFLKHLFTAIKKRPAQPLLLIVVLALAVAVCICAIDVQIYMEENDEKGRLAQNGNADILIGITSESNTRFVCVSQIREILPEGVEVCGLFSLPLLYGDRNSFVYGVASDFNNVNSIFSVEFTQYQTFTEKEKAKKIFVTQDFLKRNNLVLGDFANFNVLGQLSLQIAGVSKKKFFGTYEVLMDTDAVMDLYANKYMIFAIEEDLSPAGIIYVKSNGKEQEVLSCMGKAYPDLSVSVLSQTRDNALNGLDEQTFIIMILSIFFVMIVIYCCVYILSAQRKQEIDLFYNVGAKKYMLVALNMTEMFLYWLIGSVIGIAVSFGLAKAYVTWSNFDYCTLQLHAKSVSIALLCTLLASEFSLTIYTITDVFGKRKPTQKQKDKTQLILLFSCVLFVVMAIISYCLPLRISMFPSIIAFLLLGCMAFLMGKTSIRYLALLYKKNKSIPFQDALKNAQRVDALGNTAGVFALCIVVLFSLLTVLLSGYADVDVNKKLIQGDYLVINASESSDNVLLQTDGVDKVYHLFKGYAEVCDFKMMLIAVDNRDAISEKFDMKELPHEDEIFMNKRFAEIYNINIGDPVSVRYENTVLNCVYTKELKTPDQVLIIDASYWNIPLNYTIVKGKETHESETLYQNIMFSLSMESATVVRNSEFIQEWVDIIFSSLICADIVVGFVVAFAIIGIGDSVISSYRSRKEEFSYYYTAGMSRSDIRKMKGYEVLTAFTIGLIISLLVTVPAFLLLNRCCNTFRFDIIYIWREAL